MARYRGPRLRVIRRLGELPGFTQKVCTRNTPPGQHGVKKKVTGTQKSKESQYGVRLKEKQKLRFNYGISERQLMNYIREARRRKGSTGEILLQLLEMRLDNVVFRLGFAPTIAAARQLVTHGHVVINSKKMTIPSYLCRVKDFIAVVPNSREFVKKSFERAIQKIEQSDLSINSYLDLNKDKLEATVQNWVPRDGVALQINELLVLEYYSRKV